MTKEQEAIETMRHWIDYEKQNKDKINKADELIDIQKTVLNMLKEKDAEIEKKDKMIDLLVNKLNQGCKVFENGEIKEIVEIYEKIKSTSNLRGIELRKECIKQYFERKVENV